MHQHTHTHTHSSTYTHIYTYKEYTYIYSRIRILRIWRWKVINIFRFNHMISNKKFEIIDVLVKADIERPIEILYYIFRTLFEFLICLSRLIKWHNKKKRKVNRILAIRKQLLFLTVTITFAKSWIQIYSWNKNDFGY